MITLVPDLGVLTACLLFAVLIAPPGSRGVLGLAGLVGSMLALWASSTAFVVVSDDLTRALAGLLALTLVPTVLGLGLLVVRSVAPSRLSRHSDEMPGP